ncbi:hypothetical protein ACFDR9_003572 [Janthinobacterium sp. CG_23.3]|uniref:protealysin inhibitor emfourin n=1 Tax=unclassified Janthinobacterium TaxID=2610881 RepID=UPI000348DB86|nr:MULTISPECIES: protealysin inhibitor emfourin [unclassified Janthinobacterium]MEC5164114.1 hypothetical protein [Janthinobacterium sp. CG_S6]
MKISATSSGGFAGQGERYDIDTAASAKGKALEAALAGAGFFADRATAQPETIGADLPRWHITVDDNGRQHTLSFVEDGSPASAAWQTLLAQIRAAA